MLQVSPLSSNDYLLGLLLLSPVIAIAIFAILLVVLDLTRADWDTRRPLQWFAVAGVVTGLISCAVVGLSGYVGQPAFGGFLRVDGFALFFQAMFLLAALLVIMSSSTFMDRQEGIEGEFYAVTLFSTAGLMLMAAGNELMTIYLGLELSSLSLAFLASWNKRERLAAQGLKSTEAGIKFFLLSAMSSAILLYGMALLYGITGATSLPAIARAITQQSSLAAVLSMCMLLAGFGFKIAAAPFQLWTPDVYQGAPTPVTAFFSVASKAAGFAVILRIFNQGLPALSPEWGIVFGVLALITMTLGNLIAIVQTNIKRLMAYSSITHVGYMLIGLATIAVPGGANISASTGVMYYLLSYTVTNLAAFIVITVMTPVAPDDEIEGYAGLGTRSPALGIALTAALLSLAGIPPFAGFFAKLFLFAAAIEAQSLGLQLLVIWAVIMSAVSLYYYGRIIHSIWMRDAADTVVMRPGFGQGVALAASVTGMVLFGLVGAPFLSLAQTAATNFLR